MEKEFEIGDEIYVPEEKLNGFYKSYRQKIAGRTAVVTKKTTLLGTKSPSYEIKWLPQGKKKEFKEFLSAGFLKDFVRI